MNHNLSNEKVIANDSLPARGEDDFSLASATMPSDPLSTPVPSPKGEEPSSQKERKLDDMLISTIVSLECIVDDVNELKSSLSSLKSDLSSLKNDVSVLQDSVRSVEVDVHGIKGDICDLEDDVSRLKLECDISDDGSCKVYGPFGDFNRDINNYGSVDDDEEGEEADDEYEEHEEDEAEETSADSHEAEGRQAESEESDETDDSRD